MTKLLFGALVAALVVALAGISLAGSPAHEAKAKKQRPAKLKIARVHRDLSTPPQQVSDLEVVPCPRGYTVTGGGLSPGANQIAVSGPNRRSWVGAVGNPANFDASWSLDVVCAKGGNKWLKVTNGGDFVARKRAAGVGGFKRQYAEFKRAFHR